MSINYNNTVELVNFLYKFIYEKDDKFKDEYLYTILKPEMINLNTLIKNNYYEYQYILNSSFDKKENFKIMNIINNDILNNDDISYKKIILKKYFKNYPLTMVLQKHSNKYKDTLNIIDIYYELFINQIISEYIINDKIPFYLLNICNFNVDFANLKINKDFSDLVIDQYKLYDITDDNSKFCISLYEHYHSYETLSNFLKSELSNDDIKSIFFQTLFSYAYLNYKLTNFRHNYFTIDSFLIQKLANPQSIDLLLGDMSFKLEKTNFICKLFNYRFSCIDGFKNIYESELNNSSYDIYLFFKSLLDFKDINIKNLDKIKIIISNFISLDLINSPLMDEIKFKNRYTFSIIPIHILSKNNFFASFINMNSKSREFNKKLSKKYLKKIDTESSLEESSLTEPKIINKRLIANKKNSKKKSNKINNKEKGLNNKKSSSSSSESSSSSSSSSSNKKTQKTKKTQNNKKLENLNDPEEEIEELEDEVEEELSDLVSPDTANQEDDLIEGDDNNNKTPVENGKKKKNKKSNVSEMKREIFNLKNKIKEKEKMLKLKNKYSSSISSVTISESSDKPQESLLSTKYGSAHLKSGKNNDINNFLKNVGTDQLIPIIPEMQQMWDINQFEQNQIFSSDNNGNQPKIMDQGVINLMNSGKLPMPMMNGFKPTMSMPQMGMPQMGMPQMGMPQMGMPQMGMPQMGMPQNMNLSSQFAPPQLNTQVMKEPMPLIGGNNDNFFLKKKPK
jgi:hypothetical protein